MRETDYERLLARLLDDDLTSEQADALLKLVQEDPAKLEDLCRHLEIWQVFSELVCSHRDAERFVESCHTRIDADSDGERFLEELEKRMDREAETNRPGYALEGRANLSASSPPDVTEIRRKAERQLSQFLEERERELRAQRAGRDRQGAMIADLRGALEGIAHRIDSLLTFSAKAIVGFSVVLVVVLGLWITGHYIQSHRTVAVLDRTVYAQWAEVPDSNELRPGTFSLQQGLAELTFTRGARVIVQAPCEFRLMSPQKAICTAGTMTAHVPKSAVGFTIETPSARVVDYGTEFGVAVNTEMQSVVHVFEGEVGMASTNRRKGSGQHRLKRGENALASSEQGVQVGRSSQEHRFIREVSIEEQLGIPGKRLNLADMLGGGNGLGTGMANSAIDEITGQLVENVSPSGTGWRWFRTKLQDYPFQRVPGCDYIDGVFIPITRTGVLIVSSEEHTFEMPTKAASAAFVRGVINWCSSENGVLEQGTRLSLDGQVFESLRHPAILMRRNRGVTFDLDAIRADLPHTQIARFTSVCGVSATDQTITEVPIADFYVLVDGQQRLCLRDMSSSSGAEVVSVQIDSKDRFLTLIAAFSKVDGGGVNRALFGDPALELIPAE